MTSWHRLIAFLFAGGLGGIAWTSSGKTFSFQIIQSPESGSHEFAYTLNSNRVASTNLMPLVKLAKSKPGSAILFSTTTNFTQAMFDDTLNQCAALGYSNLWYFGNNSSDPITLFIPINIGIRCIGPVHNPAAFRMDNHIDDTIPVLGFKHSLTQSNLCEMVRLVADAFGKSSRVLFLSIDARDPPDDMLKTLNQKQNRFQKGSNYDYRKGERIGICCIHEVNEDTIQCRMSVSMATWLFTLDYKNDTFHVRSKKPLLIQD